MRRLALAALLGLACCAAQSRFEFRKDTSGWTLLRNGQPEPLVDLKDAGVTVFDGLPKWRETIRAIRREPASSTRKQLYVAFLKRQYGYQIAAVNQAYGTGATAFTELESADLAEVPAAKLEADDLLFAAEYLEGEAGELRKSKKLVLAAADARVPLPLVKGLAGSVDGFLWRGPGAPTDLLLVIHATTCPTIRPSNVAACARIVEP